MEDGAELIADRLVQALRHPFKLGPEKQTRDHRHREHRHRGLRGAHRRGPGAQRRHRDVRRQVGRQVPLRDVRDRHAGPHAGAHGARDGPARRARSKSEFFLVYQPTLDLATMRPNGVEALIRWRHPERGLVQPDDFVPLLEETGLICDVGRWVLRRGLRAGRRVARGRARDRDRGQRVRTPARLRPGALRRQRGADGLGA